MSRFNLGIMVSPASSLTAMGVHVNLAPNNCSASACQTHSIVVL